MYRRTVLVGLIHVRRDGAFTLEEAAIGLIDAAVILWEFVAREPLVDFRADSDVLLRRSF